MNKRASYGDADAKRIIERAAQIDAEEGHQLDAPALRDIAAQAGISSLAVDRALQEHESTTLAQPRGSWLKRHRTVITLAAIIAAMLFIAMTRIVVSVPAPP